MCVRVCAYVQQAIDRAVGKEGFKVVLLLRLSPLLPFALSNYFYGLTAVDFFPYLFATLLGFAPGTFAYVYTGEAAKTLTDTSVGSATFPPQYYAAVLAFLVVASKVITDVAKAALEDLDMEDEQRP